MVPVYPRHPQMLAQQALTVQAATGDRLTLGIGLSHQMVIEGMWGMSFERPARYMREYLSILAPLLNGEVVHVDGEVLTTHTFAPLEIPESAPPALLVAALAPTMLKIAGEWTDGTITWMTGVATIGNHIAPAISASAHAAGRRAPRIATSLPVTVTTDPERAREQINKAFAIYPSLPSYKAMLDKEGAAEPADVAFIGTEEQVTAQIRSLENAGATDFIAAMVGTREERERTESLLSSLVKG